MRNQSWLLRSRVKGTLPHIFLDAVLFEPFVLDIRVVRSNVVANEVLFSLTATKRRLHAMFSKCGKANLLKYDGRI